VTIVCVGEIFVFADVKSYDSGEIVCRIPDQLEVVKNFTVLGKNVILLQPLFYVMQYIEPACILLKLCT